MTLEEVGKLRIEIEQAAAKESLDDLQQLSKQINSELRLMELNGEKGSDAWKELKKAQRDVNTEIKEMSRNIDVNDASMKELQAASRQLNRELANLKIGSEEWIAKLKEVQEVDGKLAEVKKRVKGVNDEGDPSIWEQFKIAFAGAFTAQAVVEGIKAAAQMVFEFGKEVFAITSKFETYNTVLKNTLGGQEQATAAMEMIKDIAATTPISVDEMTGSFIKMVNRGLTPTKDEIKNLADLASSQAGGFDELTEAVLDAMMGESERLKAFGIDMSVNGDKVKLAFKDQRVEVDRNQEAIFNALVKMGDYNGVMGMTSEISQTLEGRTSNLGDTFDFLKLSIGEKLRPVFDWLLTAAGDLLDWFSKLINGSSPLSGVFVSLGQAVKMLWDSIVSLAGSLWDVIKILNPWMDQTEKSGNGMKVFATILQVVVAALQLVVAAVKLNIDGFRLFVTAVDTAYKVLKGDMSVADGVKAIGGAINQIKETATTSFKQIGDGFKKIWSDAGTETTTATKKVDMYANVHKSAQKEITKEQEKEIKARAKAEEDAMKKLEDARVASIKNDVDRSIAAEDLKYKREIDRINKSKASEKTKQFELEAAETLHQAALEKIRDTARQKEDQLIERWLDTDLTRKIKKAQAFANAEIAEAKRVIQDKEQQAETIKRIEANLATEVKAIRDEVAAKEEKARLDKEKAERDARDKKLKSDKDLFNATFQEEVAAAKLSLELTTNNSQAQFDAKLRLLKLEIEEKKKKLEWEAEAERNRIKDSVADNDEKAKALKGIDERLKIALSSADAKFQTDKTALEKTANDTRNANNEAFFEQLNKLGNGDVKSFFGFIGDKIREEKRHLDQRNDDHVSFGQAMKGLMKGDFDTFITFLGQKTKQDSIFNSERFQAFAKASEQIGQVATQAIGALQSLNQKYLETQLNKIEKEKKTQLDSWEKQYAAGKISKEEYEKGIDKINTDYKAKELKEKKEAFERDKKLQMANALIAGGLAFIKALASGFFPVNLVFAAATAVATGIQVAQISKQQFQARKGYVSNAGVPEGPGHGSQYGENGIALVRRDTGEEVGEMEGGEPFMILSRNTYRNNKPTIDKLLHSSLHRNGAPIVAANGAVFTIRQAVRRETMFEDGGVSGDVDQGYVGSAADTADTQAKIAENTRLQQQQATDIKRAADLLEAVVPLLREILNENRYSNGLLNDIRNKPAISVHDLYGAMDRVAAVVGKSNL